MTVGRVTQVVAETLVEPVPAVRVTQVAAEAALDFDPSARVTQVVAEVLIPAPVTPSARRRPIYVVESAAAT